MPVVGLRDLSRDTGNVVAQLEKTGEPVIVTRQGRPVAALVAVDQQRLENLTLAAAPEFAGSTEAADQALAAKQTLSLEEVLAEVGELEPAGCRAEPLLEPATVAAGRPEWWTAFLEGLGHDVVANFEFGGPSESASRSEEAEEAAQHVTRLNAELLGTYVQDAAERVRLLNVGIFNAAGSESLDLDDYTQVVRLQTRTEQGLTGHLSAEQASRAESLPFGGRLRWSVGGAQIEPEEQNDAVPRQQQFGVTGEST